MARIVRNPSHSGCYASGRGLASKCYMFGLVVTFVGRETIHALYLPTCKFTCKFTSDCDSVRRQNRCFNLCVPLSSLRATLTANGLVVPHEELHGSLFERLR